VFWIIFITLRSVGSAGFSLFRQNSPYICCCPCACRDMWSVWSVITFLFFRRVPWIRLRPSHSSAVVCSRSERCSRAPCSLCSSCRTHHCSGSSTTAATRYQDSVRNKLADPAIATYDWIGNCATEYHEKKAMQWCPTKYNLPMVVSFIIPGPPWHKNTGHEHLLDARWDLSTNDLFQEYFTLSGYCHSLVLQVISQGGREKARIAIIVSCNGLTLNRIRSRR